MMNDSTLYVGIDVSKLKHDIAIMNRQKQLLHKPLVIADDHEGYKQLVAKLQMLQKKHQAQQVLIGLEATSDYWKNLYHFLKKQSEEFVLTVINPVRTKAFAKTELRRARTDVVCAKDIARFMVEKAPAPSEDRAPLFDTIKDIDTQIYAIKKRQTMAINKLRIELGKVAPEVEKATGTIASKQMLALLGACPTAETIAGASVQQLRQIRYGKRQWRLPESFLLGVKELAEGSIAHKTGPGAGLVVQSLVRSIVHGQQESEILKEQITKLYHQIHDTESLLTTIPGIGKETTCVLEAYIGDVNRFPNSRTIVAYFGMNPMVDRSGKSKRKSYLQKKGSGMVRHKLYMATLSIIRHKQNPLYEYYERLLGAGKPKLVAIAATMRKLLTIIYAILKTQTPFDPHKN